MISAIVRNSVLTKLVIKLNYIINIFYQFIYLFIYFLCRCEDKVVFYLFLFTLEKQMFWRVKM